MRSLSLTIRTACTALFAASLMGCAIVPERQLVDLRSVPPDMIILVGKIELHPPLAPGEQMLKTEQGEHLKDAFILYVGSQPIDVSAGVPEGFAGSFYTTLEQEFFITVRRDKTLYLPGGTFYTAYDPPARVESHDLSSPLQVDLRPEDEAVYIGTVQYFRDKDNALRSVSIRDDYTWAAAQFKERLGTEKTIRKALVMPVGCSTCAAP